MRIEVLCVLVSLLFPSVGRERAPEEIPTFEIIPQASVTKFHVNASVAFGSNFDKWETSLAFTSTDLATGVLDVKIQADSVNTGSGMKDGKLKGKKFFEVEQNPLITFLSKKIVQTGADTLGRLYDNWGY